MGNILELLKKEGRNFITKGGFQEKIILTSINNLHTIEITGVTTKHWVTYAEDGTTVNAKNAHILICEKDLVELDYPVRNSNGEIALKNHKVKVKDSSGVEKNYTIYETSPSETFGFIVCILRDLKTTTNKL